MVALPQTFRPNSVVDSAFNDAVGDFFGFDFEEDRLVDAGYSLIPCMPGEKMPAEYKNGRWILMAGWNRYSKERPTLESIARWMTWPDANVGIVLGTMCAGYQLIALDFDTEDQDELDLLQSMVPVSPMSKRGARGFTAFYRAPADLRTTRYAIDDPNAPGPHKKRTVLEILTGNAPRQTSCRRRSIRAATCTSGIVIASPRTRLKSCPSPSCRSSLASILRPLKAP